MKTDIKTRWLLLLLISVFFIGAAATLLTALGDNSPQPEEPVSLYPGSDYSVYGMEVDGNVFTPTNNDPQISFVMPPVCVRSVTIVFAEAMQQDVAVQVFYAPEGEQFSEANSVRSTAWKNSAESSVTLPGGLYASIRLDMDGQVKLKEVRLNEPQEVYAARYATWLCIALLAALAITAAAFIRSGWNVEKLYPICALSLGLLYLTALTPLSVPDEGHHYQSAYELSNVLLLQADKRGLGDSADFDYTDFTHHHNTSAGYSRIARIVNAPAEQGQDIPIPTPREHNYFPMHLPQAMGLALARVLGFNFIWTFWLGRLFNLLFYILLSYWAIRIVPRFKTLFFLVALSPMSLHQAASFSYDAFVNALSLLLLALLLRAILTEKPWDGRAFGTALVVNMLLTPAKVVYYPISALALLIPEARFRNRKTRLVYLIAFFLLPLLFMLLFRMRVLRTTVVAAAGTVVNRTGGHSYTLSFLLSHPVQTVKMFIVTALKNGVDWMEGAVGLSLSGLSLPLPEWIPLGYIVLLVLASIHKEQEGPCLGGRVRRTFCAVALAVSILVMLSLCVGWTSDTSDVIQGIQGRYFIPILPLALLALNSNTLVLKRNFDRELMLMGSLMNIAALRQIIAFTMMN